MLALILFIKKSDDIFSHDSGVICLGKKTVWIPTLIKLNILKSEMDIYFEHIAHLNILPTPLSLLGLNWN